MSAPNTGSVSYSYDARGARTQLTYPDNTTLTYSYWADAQLRTVTSTLALANYSYDSVGRLQQVSRANGASTAYTYDNADRLRDLRTTLGVVDLSRFQYTVDRIGQRTAVTETLATPPLSLPSARTIAYSYDGLRRLTGATESPGSSYSYGYDLAGNRTSVTVNGTTTTRSYDAANQVSGWTYDNAGNLTGDGTSTYTYDALNRLTGRGATTYEYNGDGVLTRQVVGSTTTRYRQDLVAPLSQVLQITEGSASTNYLYGMQRLASVAGSTRTWYVGDALGSVRRTVADNGTPLGVVMYDPWGTPERGVVPTFGFTGELQDVTTGLVNLRARWYSTANSIFTAFRWETSESNDFLPYSHHPYAYALSNPINLIDPAGTCAVDDTGGPRACNPAELNFEEQLVAILNNYGSYAHLYDAATMSRGANPLNLVFDRYPSVAQTYQPGDSLRRLVEDRYPFLDSEGVILEVTRGLGTWRLDALSRGIICNDGSVLAPAGMAAGAVARLGGPGEFLSPDKGGGGGTGLTKRDRQALKDWENEGGALSPYNPRNVAKRYHDVRATEIFGAGKGRRFGRDREYDKFYKGFDIEYKSDNFSTPRTAKELARIHNQADADIMLKNAGRSNPHWHFENDPQVAPGMRSLLDKLTNNGIPWTYGPKAPF